MNFIQLTSTHKKLFAHLIPSHLIDQLENPTIFSLGIVERREGKYDPIGVLISQIEETSVEILWMQLIQEKVGKGIGSQLLQRFIQILEQDTMIQTIFVFLESDDPFLYFFRRHGFIMGALETGNTLYETNVGELAAGKLGKFAVSSKVSAFSDVSERYLKNFNNKMLLNKRDVFDTIDFPIAKEDYLPCSVALAEHGELKGCILFTEADGIISMVYGYADSQQTAAVLSCAAVRRMAEQYPADTMVDLATMNSFSKIIAQTLLSPAHDVNMTTYIYTIGDRKNE